MWGQAGKASDEVPCNAKHFKNHLIGRYLTLEHAWKEIDLNGDGVLSFNEFVAACRRIGFVGNLRQVFLDLSKDEEELKMSHLIPQLRNEEEARLALLQREQLKNLQLRLLRRSSGYLGEVECSERRRCEVVEELQELEKREAAKRQQEARIFLDHLCAKYHKLEYAWQELDLNQDGVLQFGEFVTACRKVGFHGNLKEIFSRLSGDGLVLTMSDLDPSLARREEKIVTERKKRLVEEKEELAEFQRRTMERIQNRAKESQSPRQDVSMEEASASARGSHRGPGFRVAGQEVMSRSSVDFANGKGPRWDQGQPHMNRTAC